MQRHAIITGATGFIGSFIASNFLKRGWVVTVLARQSSNFERLAALSEYHLVTYSSLNDVTLRNQFVGLKPNTLVNCAWRGVGGADRNEAFQVVDNLPLTLASVELAASLGCAHWIGLGSQAEYGNPNKKIDESEPTEPTTLYGKAKLAAGVSAMALCQARGMIGTWLRVFSTYGPNDSPRWLLPYTIEEFLAGRCPRLTKCEQRWDYLYVKDAADAVAAAAEVSAGGIFNLGSGTSLPLREYIDAICRELDCAIAPEYGAIPYRPDQVMHLEADISKLTSATGWTPSTSVATGISETVAFARCYAMRK